MLLTVILGGCYELDVPEAEQPSPVVKLTLDDDPFSGKETINLDYEASTTLEFTYEDISRVVAEAPLGWTAVVKMTGGNGSIGISAPKYGTESVQDGTVILKLYDGTGSFTEKKLTVHAVEGVLEFALAGFDTSVTSEFTLGSRTTVNYTYSPSFKNLQRSRPMKVKNLQSTLPAGWKLLEKNRGSFVIVAPDLSVESGDASGTVTITPVSWGGVSDSSLSVSFPVSVDPTKPTFQFVEEETLFNFGESKELEIVAKGLKDIVYPAVPEGWTIDWSKIEDGTVGVTAPAAGAASFKGMETLVLGATSNTDNSAISSNASVVRLFGINSADDFLAFRAVYEGTDADDPETDPETIGKWMTGDAISLNADISLGSDVLQKGAYFIKFMRVPFDGNNHTITLDFNCNAAVAGLFQYTSSEIRNLGLAGSLTNSYEAANSYIGPLSARPYAGTFVNVNSSVNVHYKVGSTILVKTDIGGIAGRPMNDNAVNFKNCSYSGTITCDNDPFSVGGIVSATDAGKPGSLVTVEDCSFSGEIILNHYAYQTAVTSRVGGIIGDLARQGVITGCTSTGNITVNANGQKYAGSTGFGFGGVVARTTAPASGYTMYATIKNCTFSGTIKVNGANGEVATCYGQIVGCVPNDNAMAVLMKDSWTENGTIIL